MSTLTDSIRKLLCEGEVPENIASILEIPVSWVYEEMFVIAEEEKNEVQI